MRIAGLGPGEPETPIGPADTVQLVTNDFMFTGGDGYQHSPAGLTSCSQVTLCSTSSSTTSGATNSPVDPVVEGRITRE